jgi:hypothetical protein
MAPFPFDAVRPFVSVTLHRIEVERRHEPPEKLTELLAEDLADKLDGLVESFDIDAENPLNLSTDEDDLGKIATWHGGDRLRVSLTGLWFKRQAAPAWLDAKLGPATVRNVANHILIVAVRVPYLAVLGTLDRARTLISDDLESGYLGAQELAFHAPVIDEETLARTYIRGKARVSWLAGLHKSIATKPDAKTLMGQDLREVFEPFADQTFTFTSVVSVLPPLEEGRPREPLYAFAESQVSRDHARYAYRVGVAPEQRRVWTLSTKDFDHFVEELNLLFDTLDLASGKGFGDDYGRHQKGFKFLGHPLPASELSAAKHAFDVGLDLPPAVDPGNDIAIGSQIEQCRELWRAYGEIQLLEANEDGADFRAAVLYAGERVIELSVQPRPHADGVEPVLAERRDLDLHHDGTECFDTVYDDDRGATLTIRYDSGHVIRGSRLFHLGWQDVLFDSWRWAFRPVSGSQLYTATKEKPDTVKDDDEGTAKRLVDLPDRKKGLGWEETLGLDVKSPASLFEYLVVHAESLFAPASGAEWHLCCDDGPGEVADFIYFEPTAGRLYLIHIKAAESRQDGDEPAKDGKSRSGRPAKDAKSSSGRPGKDGHKKQRGLSVKAYEEVVSQATKNLRYLEVGNLAELLAKGAAANYPIAKTSFRNGKGPLGNRKAILQALRGYGRRPWEKKVIVFQPHVRKSVWDKALDKLLATPTPAAGGGFGPQSQINRLLQLRTLLADAEVSCRRIGARFEVWGEDG